MTTDVTTVSFARGTAPVGDTAVFEIYIKATPERVWEAITDPDIRSKYHFGNRISSDWTPGGRFEMSHPDHGEVVFTHSADWLARSPIEVDHGIEPHLNGTVHVRVGEIVPQKPEPFAF